MLFFKNKIKNLKLNKKHKKDKIIEFILKIYIFPSFLKKF